MSVSFDGEHRTSVDRPWWSVGEDAACAVLLVATFVLVVGVGVVGERT